MTNQEIFDEVAEALMAQGRPSVKPEGVCAYVNPDGDRCAIGWLVSKDEAKEFEEKFSGEGVSELIEAGHFEGYDEEFLCELQDVHDTFSVYESRWLSSWRDGMIGIAEDYNLKTDVLDN